MASPVLAATNATYYKVSGVEISAGSYDAATNTTIGAHFVAVATTTSSPLTSGILDVLVNYQGNGPNSTGDKTNKIVGGKWTLSVASRTVKGTITGSIDSTGSTIIWKTYKLNVTGWGTPPLTCPLPEERVIFPKYKLEVAVRSLALTIICLGFTYSVLKFQPLVVN